MVRNVFIHIKRIKPIKSQEGFTLIEMVAILIIAAIISAVVVTNMTSSTDTYEKQSSISIVKNHIRYAQLRAMKNNTSWGIKSDGTDYWLFKGTNPSLNKDDPPGGAAGTIPNAFTAIFDRFGIPDLSGNFTITAGSDSFNISRETGYIQE